MKRSERGLEMGEEFSRCGNRNDEQEGEKEVSGRTAAIGASESDNQGSKQVSTSLRRPQNTEATSPSTHPHANKGSNTGQSSAD